MTGLGSTCGACKFLRRKCITGCIFAPYFSYDQGASHFAAIHKVFGASNVSKLLLHIPLYDRGDAAMTLSYEAQARLRDPVYGCVGHIFALQQQVANLQEQIQTLAAKILQSQSSCSYNQESTVLNQYTDRQHSDAVNAFYNNGILAGVPQSFDNNLFCGSYQQDNMNPQILVGSFTSEGIRESWDQNGMFMNNPAEQEPSSVNILPNTFEVGFSSYDLSFVK